MHAQERACLHDKLPEDTGKVTSMTLKFNMASAPYQGLHWNNTEIDRLYQNCLKIIYTIFILTDAHARPDAHPSSYVAVMSLDITPKCRNCDNEWNQHSYLKCKLHHIKPTFYIHQILFGQPFFAFSVVNQSISEIWSLKIQLKLRSWSANSFSSSAGIAQMMVLPPVHHKMSDFTVWA